MYTKGANVHNRFKMATTNQANTLDPRRANGDTYYHTLTVSDSRGRAGHRSRFLLTLKLYAHGKSGADWRTDRCKKVKKIIDPAPHIITIDPYSTTDTKRIRLMTSDSNPRICVANFISAYLVISGLAHWVFSTDGIKCCPTEPWPSALIFFLSHKLVESDLINVDLVV